MITIYGIPNCDTVKKALEWINYNHIKYTFHNYKTEGITNAKLNEWVDTAGWESILNMKSATYRKLIKEGEKEVSNAKSAIRLMSLNTSCIKRPIIEKGGIIIVGFDPVELKQVFHKN